MKYECRMKAFIPYRSFLHTSSFILHTFFMRHDGRKPDELRPLKIKRHFTAAVPGSAGGGPQRSARGVRRRVRGAAARVLRGNGSLIHAGPPDRPPSGPLTGLWGGLRGRRRPRACPTLRIVHLAAAWNGFSGRHAGRTRTMLHDLKAVRSVARRRLLPGAGAWQRRNLRARACQLGLRRKRHGAGCPVVIHQHRLAVAHLALQQQPPERRSRSPSGWPASAAARRRPGRSPCAPGASRAASVSSQRDVPLGQPRPQAARAGSPRSSSGAPRRARGRR